MLEKAEYLWVFCRQVDGARASFCEATMQCSVKVARVVADETLEDSKSLYVGARADTDGDVCVEEVARYTFSFYFRPDAGGPLTL